MCGIFCSILLSCENHTPKSEDSGYKILDRRGPDIKYSTTVHNLYFKATVLWHQGTNPQIQPIQENHRILLFNGDVFMKGRPNQNLSDTRWIFNELSICDSSQKIINFVKKLKGPYSLIYYDEEKKDLWWFRDSLGRNSLLLGRCENQIVITSATIYRKDFIELPPLGIFCCNLSERDNMNIKLYPWMELGEYHLNLLDTVIELMDNRIDICDPIEPDWLKSIQLDVKYDYDFHNILNNEVKDSNISIFSRLLMNPSIAETCHQLIELLSQSVHERVMTTQGFCRACLPERLSCYHSRIGILFSGGIDCTVIAVLADRYIDSNIPIDLINVSFEKVIKCLPNNHNSKKLIPLEGVINWNVPDRVTAIATHKELCRVCPNRQWNLVEVNVTRAELTERLSDRISDLINPLKSVLDESLGAALWFAARGDGIIDDKKYKSENRVLLLGSGADELFGGYTRHRNAYNRETNVDATTTLRDELELDWIRLPSRNLARDDRVISDHGATPRTPYLQEDFVKFVRNLKPLQKCFHRLEQGVGDKLLLRLCAYRLGLTESCTLKKRALQFGSRIADSKQNAKDISTFL